MPSQDPAQQKLRQTKKQWNKKVSLFADDLFRFKDMMNGKPSKFFKERSSIKNPIPGDPLSILTKLTSEFQDIAREGAQIVQMQVDYSKTRKKGKEKVLPESPPNLSQQLKAYDNNLELISEASSPISRFFTKLLNPSWGTSPEARIRKYRLSLLNVASEISKNLKKLQIVIVGKDAESIFVAAKHLVKIENDWKFLVQGLKAYSDRATQSSDQKSNQISIVDRLIADYKKYVSVLNVATTEMDLAVKEYSHSDNPESLVGKVVSEYQKLLNEVNKKHNSNEKSFADIFKTSKSLNTVAQSFINKWIGKTRHQLSEDKTSAIRLDIYEMIGELIKDVDKIMNSLEKGLDINELHSLISIGANQVEKIREMIRGLQLTLTGKSFESPFISELEKGKLTEFSPNLTDKQKEHLQNLIERQKLRELTHLYYK